jgi:LDH2 family malate/lactate/ureidoglycolate dehydrogenase
MPVVGSERLGTITTAIFQAAGVPEGVATRVSASLVEANLTGHDSHGVIRIPQYLEKLREGQVDPRAKIEVLAETATTARLDAHWGFGQPAADQGMRIAIDKARTAQVGVVTMRHSNHIGRLGEYSMMAADHDFIGLVCCNSSLLAAPYGGMHRILSTNPISCALPAGRRGAFLLDFATTTYAEGKIRVAREKGEQVPEGCIIDKRGQPTTAPQDLYDGGMLLPMGAYKGYALGLLVDILGGVLSGHGATSSERYDHGNGVMLMALDIAFFCPLEQFEREVESLLDRAKAVPAAPGFSEVLVPGEPEFRSKEARLQAGIPVPERVWQSILAEAERVSVDVNAAPGH